MPLRNDEKLLRQARNEFEEIRREMELVPARYTAALRSLRRAAASIDMGNTKGALEEIALARTQVEGEQLVQGKKMELDDKLAKTSNYTSSERELKLETLLASSVSSGDFDKAKRIVALLDSEIRKNISGNIESCLEIVAPSDVTLEPGKGNTIKIILANNGPLPISLISLAGKSDHGRVTVFRKFTGLMKPESKEMITVNIIPDIEGDVVLEISAEIEAGSKKFTLTKQTSLHVASKSIDLQAVKDALAGKIAQESSSRAMVSDDLDTTSKPRGASASVRSDEILQGVLLAVGTNQNAARTSSGAPATVADPMELVENGSIDAWAGLLSRSFENRAMIDLSGIQEVYPDYKTKKGYRNLLIAPLRIDIDSTDVWEAWLNNGGMNADEFTNRCFRLICRFAACDMRVEFEHDSSVGSTDKDYFTAALNIAAGYMDIDKEKRRQIRSWKISVSNDGAPGAEYMIERTTRKDERAQIVLSTFSTGGQNCGANQVSGKRTRVVRSG